MLDLIIIFGIYISFFFFFLVNKDKHANAGCYKTTEKTTKN